MKAKLREKKMSHFNVEEDEYRKNPALGSTDISMMLDNPRKFYLSKKGDLSIETPSMLFGRAFHMYLLERDRFFESYAVSPCDDKRKKEYKEFVKTATLPVLSRKELEEIEKLASKCFELPRFRELLEKHDSRTEASYFGEIEGVPVKCRLDVEIFEKEGVIVIDPKTTIGENTSLNFEKSAIKYNYHLQEWLYTEIVKQNGKKVLDYLFLQVSRLDYSGASFKQNSLLALEQAEEDVRKALRKYKMYKEKYGDKIWPEYEQVVETVNFPQWGYYKYQDQIF